MVVGDGECGKLIEVHVAGPVHVHKARAHGTKLEALCNHLRADAETGGNVLDAHLLPMQFGEGFELVGGVHGTLQGIFRQRQFGGIVALDDLPFVMVTG